MTTIALDARKVADFGIGTYVRGLVGALARLDSVHRYLLLAGDEGPVELPWLPGNFRWVEERAPGYSLSELFTVSRALRRERVDLFHSPHYVLPLGLPCPAVVTIHDLIQLRFPAQFSWPARLYARRMIGRAVARAAAVLTVSEATAADLAARFGAPRERIEVIPNGVDEAFARPLGEADLDVALGRLGLARGYLLFVGNPKPHKNLGGLLAACARLREARPDAPPLVIAGERERDRPAIDALVAGHRAGAWVRRTGFVPAADLPALYQGATLLVQPSLWEGFGLPVAEAMAAGTPVVAARRGALPEVGGDAAALFEPEDAEALAALLGALLDDPGRRAEMVRRGRERAAGLRWEETARRTLAVYRRLLEAPAAAGSVP